jgi:halimadienyl-diphosphate synthase
MRLIAYLDLAVKELLRSDLSYLPQVTDYDTSWAARLSDGNGGLAYPHLLQMLVDRQHEDGSWGGQIPYSHDRFLSTLSVVILLALYGDRSQDEQARQAGERYLWQHVLRLQHDIHPTVGFEMILPALLREAQELSLDLPYRQLAHYEVERDRKLSLLPDGAFSRTPTSALFSLEAFATSVVPDRMTSLLLEDGSMAGSPSATAWLLGQFPDWRQRYPRSAAYVENLLARYPAGLPTIAPYDIFARSWVLYYLHHGNLLVNHHELVKSHLEHLYSNWHSGGVGWSSYAFHDADDTAMTLLALNRGGYDVDGSVLLDYEHKDHFAVYNYEKDASVSANLHILKALDTLPERDRPRVRDKIVKYVLSSRRHSSYWTDKWHASPYYPTSQAVIALIAHAPDELKDTLHWLYSTQRPDGSWGQYEPTVEETSLALLSLLLYHREVAALPPEAMRQAAKYLLENENPFKNDYPQLWIAKTLYSPTFVVRSMTLAALKLYADTFGAP